MTLNTLSLSNFRNLDKVRLEFVSGINVLLGQNGHGKTNVLESICFLLRGTSFKSIKLNEVIMEGQPHSTVWGTVSKQATNKIEVEIKAQAHIKLNEKRIYKHLLREQFPLVLFEPESLLAIKKGPELRRDLLDELVVLEDGTNLKTLRDFKKALKLRNQVLKSVKEKTMPLQKAKMLLECSTESYLALATEVVSKRLGILEKIAPEVKRLFYDITKKPNLELYYAMNKTRVLDKDKNYLSRLIKEELVFEKEVLYGFSLSGPHTDDLDFVVGQRKAKTYLSQGEQRALILAFKAALVYHGVAGGKKILLLLDDVFSELDVRKREFLVHILRQAKSQIIITTTEVEKTVEFDRLFLVKNGRIDKI